MNLTPKEKAEQIVKNMYNKAFTGNSMSYYEAVECAKIAVDEIIDYCSDIYDKEFMLKVKQEIEKL